MHWNLAECVYTLQCLAFLVICLTSYLYLFILAFENLIKVLQCFVFTELCIQINGTGLALNIARLDSLSANNISINYKLALNVVKLDLNIYL